MTASAIQRLMCRETGFPPPLDHVGHVGVWLDRCYLPQKSDGAKSARANLYDKAIDALRAGRPTVATYEEVFARWQRDIAQTDRRQTMVIVEAATRVLMHPASNSTVTEGGILLHHTWGVPYLPGSGLKGLARAWARRAVYGVDPRHDDKKRSDERDPEMVRGIFGRVPRGDEEDAESAVVEFLDAMWMPTVPPNKPVDWSPLALDIVNPHHSEYYVASGGKAPSPPSDTEEPIPTQRLSVAPGARFLVVVELAVPGADEWLAHTVDDLLLPALREMGFGAWTSSGYGRFHTPGAKPGSRADAPSRETYDVIVNLDPGPGRLTAVLPGEGRRVARAENPKANELRGTLPVRLQEALKKKRTAKLRVLVEKNGNAWWIVGLQDPEG